MKKLILFLIFIIILSIFIIPEYTLNEVNLQNMYKFSDEYTIANSEYIPVTHDCKQFSWELRQAAEKQGLDYGIVFGIYNGEFHFWNCFEYDGKVYYVEPQLPHTFWQENSNYHPLIIFN